MAINEAGLPVWDHTNVRAGGMLLGTYDLAGLHFFLTDPLGTRRVQTDYAGAVEQTCSSLPFGEALQCTLSTAAPTEELFAGLERDDTGLDHAQARQYSSLLGRWTAPDPYDGSLDAGDPQSLNRYAYVNNRPLSMTDPSGLDGEGGGGVFSGAGGCLGAIMSEGTNVMGDIGCAIGILENIFGGGPQRHQVVRSGNRPGAHNWDEHGAWKPTQQSLASLLGVPQAGCEFGTCGFAPDHQTASGMNPFPEIISAEAWLWAMHADNRGVHGIWTYGNWCGTGGSGNPTSKLDGACLQHDYCYYKNKLSAGDNITHPSVALQSCNQALCDAADAVTVTKNRSGGDLDEAGAAAEVFAYFTSVKAVLGVD